jgi:hypothetical protein
MNLLNTINAYNMGRSKIFLAIGLVGLISWHCSKEVNTIPSSRNQGVLGNSNLSLKESFTVGVARINNAFAKISETQGYHLLSARINSMSMSASSFKDSITLGLIGGIYVFQTDSLQPRHFGNLARLFSKMGASSDLIVKLPQKFIFYPGYLREVVKKDSALANNFTIDASDYHYYFTGNSTYDYKLSAGFVLDSLNIGSMNVVAERNAISGGNYNVKYSFNDGYYLTVAGLSGDSAQSSMTLSSDSGIILQESVSYANSGFGRMHEAQYILTIGNVELKRSTGVDSIQVFLNGVLQNKAGARISDSTANSNGTIIHGRDIQLIFNDGTTTTLAALLKPSYTVMSGLVNSLQNMYFATNVIDYIAFSIYENEF